MGYSLQGHKESDMTEATLAHSTENCANMIDQDGNMHHLRARGWTMTWNSIETIRNGEGINLSRSADAPGRTEKGGLAAKVLDVPYGGGLKDTG